MRDTYVTQDGSCETGDDTRPESDGELLSRAEVLLLLRGHALVHRLQAPLVDGELADSVGNLLAEDGDESSVQRPQALSLENLGKGGDEAIRVLRCQWMPSERLPLGWQRGGYGSPHRA